MATRITAPANPADAKRRRMAELRAMGDRRTPAQVRELLDLLADQVLERGD